MTPFPSLKEKKMDKSIFHKRASTAGNKRSRDMGQKSLQSLNNSRNRTMRPDMCIMKPFVKIFKGEKADIMESIQTSKPRKSYPQNLKKSQITQRRALSISFGRIN